MSRLEDSGRREKFEWTGRMGHEKVGSGQFIFQGEWVQHVAVSH